MIEEQTRVTSETDNAREAARKEQEAASQAANACRAVLETPAPFVAWLRALPRRRICGDVCVGSRSPLANFLSEQCGHFVMVGVREAQVCGPLDSDTAKARFRTLATLKLPEWARRVERRCQLVTAGRVLDVISEVRAGLVDEQL